MLNNDYIQRILITKCNKGVFMKNKSKALQDLESYWFENQYYAERRKDAETLATEINNCLFQQKDMELKGYDTTAIKFEIEQMLLKQKNDESALIIINAKNKKIESLIEDMPQPHKNVLFLKYIKNNSFEQIAGKMSYSNKRIYQLHKEALQIYTERQNKIITNN